MSDLQKITECIEQLATTARRKEDEAVKLGISGADRMSLERSGEARGISIAVRMMADVMGIEIGPVLDHEDIRVTV